DGPSLTVGTHAMSVKLLQTDVVRVRSYNMASRGIVVSNFDRGKRSVLLYSVVDEVLEVTRVVEPSFKSSTLKRETGPVSIVFPHIFERQTVRIEPSDLAFAAPDGYSLEG